jgi:hypothetical protein
VQALESRLSRGAAKRQESFDVVTKVFRGAVQALTDGLSPAREWRVHQDDTQVRIGTKNVDVSFQLVRLGGRIILAWDTPFPELTSALILGTHPTTDLVESQFPVTSGDILEGFHAQIFQLTKEQQNLSEFYRAEFQAAFRLMSSDLGNAMGLLLASSKSE